MPYRSPHDGTDSTGVGADLQVMFRESLLAACPTGAGPGHPLRGHAADCPCPVRVWYYTKRGGDVRALPAPPRFTLQQIPQPPAGLVQLRFGTPCRALQSLRNFAVFVSNDVVE